MAEISTESEDEAALEAEISALNSKLSKLRKKLKSAKAEIEADEPALVSPLAPKDGFPALPEIDGVRFSATEARIKYSDRLDVMLASIAPGSSLAGVFTRSSTRSAPVLDCQEKLKKLAENPDDDQGYAILVNSGNANAFTGSDGADSVRKTTTAVARCLEIPDDHVFSASTGVIGEPLPANKIVKAMERLRDGLASNAIEDAAKAIMTTDTFTKGAWREVQLGEKTIKIAGIAKGSGMIEPDMATMLVFIFTDAAVDQVTLQKMLSKLNENTFNSITVDSDTSTSDSLILAATGKSGVEVTAGRSPAHTKFSNALGEVMLELAHLVVRDGEGATKFLEVEVTGATSRKGAKQIAKSIANSPLVKTAVAGEDPNWGRVVMAVGKSGAFASRDMLTIRFGDILVADKGWVSPDYHERDGAAYMKGDELKISVDVGLGKASARVWTCDFTKQYITINADYRS